jgi:hypothetical protein
MWIHSDEGIGTSFREESGKGFKTERRYSNVSWVGPGELSGSPEYFCDDLLVHC